MYTTGSETIMFAACFINLMIFVIGDAAAQASLPGLFRDDAVRADGERAQPFYFDGNGMETKFGIG